MKQPADEKQSAPLPAWQQLRSLRAKALGQRARDRTRQRQEFWDQGTRGEPLKHPPHEYVDEFTAAAMLRDELANDPRDGLKSYVTIIRRGIWNWSLPAEKPKDVWMIWEPDLMQWFREEERKRKRK